MNTIPADIAVAADYLHHAQSKLDPKTWAWLAGASGGGVSKINNRSDFENVTIFNRILRPLGEGHTRVELLGQTLRHPMLLAPIGFQRLLNDQGEVAVAQGADATDTCMIVSTLSSVDLETVSQATAGPKWFQLYFQPSRDDTLKLVQRAKAANYRAIVVTVDTPVQALSTMAQRAGFNMPADIQPANLASFSAPPARALGDDDSIIFQGAMRDAPSWEDLEWLIEQSDLPVLVKGISHPEDAQACVERGAKGIVVSNHGGRSLDAMAGTATLLSAIRKRLGQDATILMDGGVQSGSDVFKALALGADAVLIGRLQAAALAVGGALGVAHMMKLMRDEFEICMALAGCETLTDIGRETISISPREAL